LANLAMSDHLSRAPGAMDPLTLGPKASLPNPAVPRSFSAQDGAAFRRSNMSARYIPKTFAAKIHDPFNSEHDPIYALLTAGAFVAVADGCVDSAEREEAVRYIDQAIMPKMAKARVAELFDQCAQLLQDRNFAEVVVEALRPVPALSLTPAVIEIAEWVAVADGTVHSNEVQAIRLIRLITIALPEPQAINSSHT
jgi:tellurite resistance protein TerB